MTIPFSTVIGTSSSDRNSHTAVLPVPPSINRYWKNWRGRIVLSSEGREYKLTVAHMLEKIKPFKDDVAVHVRVYRARRSGDLDNYLKCLLDALKGFFWVDDRQITQIFAHRHDDKDNPRVHISAYDIKWLEKFKAAT